MGLLRDSSVGSLALLYAAGLSAGGHGRPWAENSRRSVETRKMAMRSFWTNPCGPSREIDHKATTGDACGMGGVRFLSVIAHVSDSFPISRDLSDPANVPQFFRRRGKITLIHKAGGRYPLGVAHDQSQWVRKRHGGHRIAQCYSQSSVQGLVEPRKHFWIRFAPANIGNILIR